ncbi:hypothetical protein [Streptomyces parvus]|uniref:hypothetical protein n=1 Tax=Streptomyces parvus TaxID=66428 RepID=UPI0035E29F45
MSAAAILTKTLSDSRQGLIGWAVGTALVGMVYASTYPFQRENVDSVPEALRQSLNADGMAVGCLQASVFGISALVWLAVLAVRGSAELGPGRCGRRGDALVHGQHLRHADRRRLDRPSVALPLLHRWRAVAERFPVG